MGSRERAPQLIEITSLSAIEHILRHRPERIQRLIFSATSGHAGARIGNLLSLAREKRIPTDAPTHGGRAGSPGGDRGADPVRAFLSAFRYAEFREFLDTQNTLSSGVVLALDHLQDPQNFGALCRTAEGLGVQGILLPKDRSVAVGPGVYNASVGAVETLPIVLVNNLAEALRKLKENGFWVVGAALGADARPPWEMPAFDKVALVLGTEWEGLAPSIEKLCDWRVQIPLSGRVQSLNVSAAGAILMYHLQNPTRLAPLKP